MSKIRIMRFYLCFNYHIFVLSTK